MEVIAEQTSAGGRDLEEEEGDAELPEVQVTLAVTGASAADGGSKMAAQPEDLALLAKLEEANR